MLGNNVASATYSYDADGRRVMKVSGGVTTHYVYDAQGNLALENTVSGTPPGVLWGTTYQMGDHLCSIRMQTDGNGGQRALYDYAPFGEELTAADGRDARWGGPGTGFHFTGKEQEGIEGDYMHYFGARYYAAGLGRFTSPDPVYFQKEMLTDPQRWNLYAYARNNPLRFIDPKGEAIELVGDEEERKKALEALRRGVGAQAGSYLYENKVTTKDKNGNEATKYYVGIYTNGPDANGTAFEKVNAAAASLGGIINSQQAVSFGLVSNHCCPKQDRPVAGPAENGRLTAS